jgi:hypothetical protein
MPEVNTPQSVCRCGVARCEITPPIGIYHRMWGAATHEQATGIHRPLTATALVMQSAIGPPIDDNEQIWLAIDHCILWGGDMDRLLDAVALGAEVPRQRLTVAFSHSHSAGLMDTTRADRPGGTLIAPYLEELARRLAGIVRTAREQVQPAALVYGIGHCDLAGQRDLWDENTGQYVCGFNPQGQSDDTLVVARITAADGAPLASIVNYACHPTTLAWQNTLISPDYPGAMREVIEQATGAPCVFLQGASGDMGPREGYVGDTDVADRNGRQLGYAALSTLTGLPPGFTRFEYAGPVVSGATLGTWRHAPLDDAGRRASALWRMQRFTVDLDRRAEAAGAEALAAQREEWRAKREQARAAGDETQARDCHAMIERIDRQLARIAALPEGPTFPLPVTLLRTGGAWWVAVEGEPYNVLQRALRRRFPETPIVVVVLANGARSTYLPPAGVYGKGIYQESIAMLAPGSLEKLIDAISQRMAADAPPS